MTRLKGFICAVLILTGTKLLWANTAPVVSNVTASQRTDDSKLVDIHYDLVDADGDSCTVWVAISDNGGTTWNVPAYSFTGAYGVGIIQGTNKHIVWDAGADIPGKVGNFKARVYADDGKGPATMVLVPAGPFLYKNSIWTNVVTFSIDKFEVTNSFYCQFLNSADPTSQHWNSTYMEITRSGSSGNYYYTPWPTKENYPAHVNYYDAEAFAQWRSALEGKPYHLPNEYQWEKAAAWDPVQQHYYLYGCHRETIDCSWVNYMPSSACYGSTTPTGYFNGTPGRNDAKSYYGCYDMCGNVWEWTTQTTDGTNRVVRGGSWVSTATQSQTSYQYTYAPSAYGSGTLGFRLVLDIE